MLPVLLREVLDLRRNRCKLQVPQEPRDHRLLGDGGL